jgi:pyruvate kinase
MMMDRIVRTAESRLDVWKFEHLPEMAATRDSITRSTYFIAKEVGAAAIIAPTWSGSTASFIGRFRPKQPILATTPNEITLHFLSLCWGVVPLSIPLTSSIDDMIRFSIDAGRSAGYLEPGQNVVVTGGLPLFVSGNTNFIKVARVE